MTKYRIIEEVQNNGAKIYYPQFRWCFIWISFSHIGGFSGNRIALGCWTKEEAEEEIEEQIGRDIKEINVIEYD